MREGHLHIEAPGAYAEDRGRIEAARVASAEIYDKCGAKGDPVEGGRGLRTTRYARYRMPEQHHDHRGGRRNVIDFPTVWPEEAIIAHTANSRGRDLVIGDLHGHFDTLENALEQLSFDPSRDRLFSVGDLIDRGPRSEATVEWIASRRMHTVRGNHEQTMVKALTLEPGRLFKSGASGHWLDNGGGWWFGFEGLDETGWPIWRESPHPKRADEWLAALRTVPYLRTIETPAGRVGIVHTGTDLYRDWKELDAAMRMREDRAREAPDVYGRQGPIGVLWERPAIERESAAAPDLPAGMHDMALVLIGHTPDLNPRWTRKNVLCIDTGVHVPEWGHLTVAEVQTATAELHRFRRVEPPATPGRAT